MTWLWVVFGALVVLVWLLGPRKRSTKKDSWSVSVTDDAVVEGAS